MRQIGYLDEPVQDYVKGLRECATLDALRVFAKEWADLCPDSLAVVETLDEESFETFRKGLLNHKRWAPERQAAWATSFGAISVPGLLLHVGMIADSCHVPWGAAFRRMVDVGRIKVDVDAGNYLIAALDEEGKAE